MKEQLKSLFEGYLATDQAKTKKLTKSIQQLTLLRFAAFAGIILAFVYLHNPYNILVSLFLFALFLYWVRIFIKNEKEKILYQKLIEINKNELQAIDEVYSQFESGKEFIDPQHSYSYDLDLFGEGSIFQLINRTGTQLGKKKLANCLSSPLLSINELEDRQKALSELAQKVRWRQFFGAKAQSHDEQDFKLLQVLSNHQTLPRKKLVNILIKVLPVITLVSLILAVFQFLPWVFFTVLFLVNISVLGAWGKTIKNFYQSFGNQSRILANYRELIIQVENEKFESKYLQNLKDQLGCENHKASEIIGQLQKTMSRFDYRANILFVLIAEPIFLWDLQCIYKLDQWHSKYHDKISHWFDIIAEFDALSSLGNLNHIHPDWTEPTFRDEDFILSAKNLGHPIIKSDKRIGNDFNMDGNGKISIITGANMAGKSTFLRTIGVNMILAMNGCMVCAEEFEMQPISLYTNMRTTDNLQNEESYFFAELLRLQQMLERIKNGVPHFIIVDEMLKGTNSTDKLNGSKALVEQLTKLNANGLVATHDLKLTELANQFPDQIMNQCFDVRLTEDNLAFDYKLHKGVTSTMNATFLMKKMGIIQ